MERNIDFVSYFFDLPFLAWLLVDAFIFFQEGFISGASDGQTGALQEGFNQGFKTGFSDTFLLSKIKGLLK